MIFFPLTNLRWHFFKVSTKYLHSTPYFTGKVFCRCFFSYWLSHSFCSISLWWITLTSPLWGRYGNVLVVGGISMSRTPVLMPNSFFLLLMCFISLLNIAITFAYIIYKPIQLHSVFQFLSQCLSFNILICSLIWDLQSIGFIPPSMCCFKRNMSSMQVSSLSRCAAETNTASASWLF